MAEALMWPDEIYRILRDWDVTQFSYVPDAGHAVLINRSLEDPEVHSVALTTEEEGVAMLAGAHLGGARGVVLMQSSGVGNRVNMFSFAGISARAIPGRCRWGRPYNRFSRRVASSACALTNLRQSPQRFKRPVPWCIRLARQSLCCSRRV